MSDRQLRDILRWTHIAAGAALSVIIWTPLVDESAFLWIARIGLVPFLLVGGLWMWLQSRTWASRRAAPEA